MQACPIGFTKNPESSRKSSLGTAEEVHSASARATYRESKVGGGGG